MTLAELVREVPDFDSWSYADKIRLFCWYLETYGSISHVWPADVEKCFDQLNLERPTKIGPFFQSMGKSKPKQLLRSTKGYSLERRVKQDFDSKYGQRESTIVVDKMLSDLPAKVPGLAERGYLDEVLICFRHKAFRAAIVMVWNLAYDHFVHWIFGDNSRLAAFNKQLPLSYKNADIAVINTIDDFSFLKEHQVLAVAKKANIINPNLHNITLEKLKRRNVAAHPSSTTISQPTAEDCITDLVNNVVLQLK